MKTFEKLFVFLLFVFVYSCDENIYEDQDGAWTGIIVPGKSIEGIKLGDSREEVVSKLGEPATGGIADGQFRSWFGSDYSGGAHAGLSIYYLELQGGSHGPADIITATRGYKGMTKKGIRIGSQLTDVHKVFGDPDRTLADDSGFISDIYCINHKHFEIHYEDSLVTSFSLGYFLPPPDEFNDCK